MTQSITPALVLTVWPPFFDQVRLGNKTVEGRPFTARYQNLKIGDFIQIVDKGACNNFVVEITQITKYPSFLKMLENEGLAHCLPGVESIEKGVEAYHSFPNYVDQEQQFGVIALGIKVYRASLEVALNYPALHGESITTRTVTVEQSSDSKNGPDLNDKREASAPSPVESVAKRQFKTIEPAIKKAKSDH